MLDSGIAGDIDFNDETFEDGEDDTPVPYNGSDDEAPISDEEDSMSDAGAFMTGDDDAQDEFVALDNIGELEGEEFMFDDDEQEEKGTKEGRSKRKKGTKWTTHFILTGARRRTRFCG